MNDKRMNKMIRLGDIIPSLIEDLLNTPHRREQAQYEDELQEELALANQSQTYFDELVEECDAQCERGAFDPTHPSHAR